MSLESNSQSIKTCVCISCFNYYDTRIKMIKSFFESKGYKVTYITSDYNHFEKTHFKADYPDTIQVHVPLYKKNISFKRLLSQYIFAKRAYEITKKLHPDVIYCMYPPNSIVCYIARYKKKTGCKIVFDGYDLWPESFPASRMKSLFKIPFKLWAELRDNYIETADLILAVSQSMLDAVKDKWKSTPIKLLKPAIIQTDLPVFNFDCSKSISFCYLGNVNHITDIDLLTELLIGVSKSKEVILHIIGEGQNLQSLLAALNTTNIKCITHGVVMDNNQKKDIFAKCHLALNLPREVIHSTMSLKSVEYMSVGLPYVNTGEGDNWDVVEKYGIGFNVERNAIKECVEKIVKVDSIMLKNMHKKCLLAYRERFVSVNLDTVLEEVLV